MNFFRLLKNRRRSKHILIKLINLSDNNYGVVECNSDFYKTFSDIPRETLFKICMHLSNKLFVDYDNYDEKNFTFDRIYILPQAYTWRETRIVNKINILLSVTAIIIALISLKVSMG